MTTLPIAEAKARFSAVVRRVEDGDEVVVTRGPKEVPVAVIVPIAAWRQAKGRRLGLLADWGEFRFADDWAISDSELIGEAAP
jgi:prevent-host-death family protein